VQLSGYQKECPEFAYEAKGSLSAFKYSYAILLNVGDKLLAKSTKSFWVWTNCSDSFICSSTYL